MLVPLWYIIIFLMFFYILVNCYFQVSFNLKVLVLYEAKITEIVVTNLLQELIFIEVSFFSPFLRINQALMFDGVDDHVILPSIHTLGLTDRYAS